MFLLTKHASSFILFLPQCPFCLCSPFVPFPLIHHKGKGEGPKQPGVMFIVLRPRNNSHSACVWGELPTLLQWPGLRLSRDPGPPRRPDGAADGPGPRRVFSSTHQVAPGWETSRSRCRRDTEGGCRGSQKTHFLHGVGGRETGTKCQSRFEKCQWHSPFT